MNEGLLGTEDDRLLHEGGDDGYIFYIKNMRLSLLRLSFMTDDSIDKRYESLTCFSEVLLLYYCLNLIYILNLFTIIKFKDNLMSTSLLFNL